MTNARLRAIQFVARNCVPNYGPEDVYLEPWQREPVDPSVPHVVTIEYRDEWPPAHTTCSCGFDRGWQSVLDAEFAARWHRDQAEIGSNACPKAKSSL